jgi:hypothetical protein
MEKFRKANIRPVVWSHIDLSFEISEWLHRDWIAGVVTVSDFCRLALLHHSKHRRIGRIYNPLNPFYADVKTYLGRPWRVYAKTVFVRTEMPRKRIATG